MIIDSSAVVAIVKGEPAAEALTRIIADALVRRISAANLLEIYMVIDRADTAWAKRELDVFLFENQPIVEVVTAEQVAIARVAFQRFGKGSGHRAGLNFGDCFAYALAKERDEPLLFIGNDFAATDIAAAWPVSSA